jgi:hypothetical protein
MPEDMALIYPQRKPWCLLFQSFCGIVEQWNNGVMQKPKQKNLAIFYFSTQFSNTPALLRQLGIVQAKSSNSEGTQMELVFQNAVRIGSAFCLQIRSTKR